MVIRRRWATYGKNLITPYTNGLGAAVDEATYHDKWNRILDWYKTYFAKADEKDKKTD